MIHLKLFLYIFESLVNFINFYIFIILLKNLKNDFAYLKRNSFHTEAITDLEKSILSLDEDVRNILNTTDKLYKCNRRVAELVTTKMNWY
jgi:hypothetical protein